MSTVTEESPVELKEPVKEYNHDICCRDQAGLISLCGLDVSNEPWDNSGTDYCPKCELEYQKKTCPYFGRCTESDDYGPIPPPSL